MEPRACGLGAYAVVTPYSDLPDYFAAPDCPRWWLHGRADIETLGQRIEDNARRASQGKRAPSRDDVELVSEILKRRGFTGYDRDAEAVERQGTADRLTSEQAMLLQVTRLLPRVEVRGGGGPGTRGIKKERVRSDRLEERARAPRDAEGTARQMREARARDREAARHAAARARADRAAAETARRAATPHTPPSDSQSSGGGGASNPYPGYTGPRCYAPGGKTWRPCP